MLSLRCPICDSTFEVSDKTKEGTRITCPNCFAQLKLRKKKGGGWIAPCALCGKEIIDFVHCEDCEKKLMELERRKREFP